MACADLEKLKKLGFTAAHDRVEKSRDLARRLHIAYQNFEFITEDMVEKFRDDIKKRTTKDHKNYVEYQTLVFKPVAEYDEVPPQDVLDKMESAVQLGCFDTFEVAKIESVQEVKDPILFGRVEGCGDRFFIAQWDDDVTIEAIKKASDGV